MIDYSKLVKEYRDRNFLTQEDFAKMIGVSPATVNRWEKEHFEPNIKMKKVLFELFKKANMNIED